MIKIASERVSIPFTYIYNPSIANGIVPDECKISRVTPIYKSGEVTNTRNYRPIATLSRFSKVLEWLIHDRFYLLLEKKKKDIIYEYQFGFRKGYSTEPRNKLFWLIPWTQQSITNKFHVAYSSFFQKHFIQLTMVFFSLNYILVGSVELHFKWLKATYAIVFNILRLMKLNPVWKLLHVEFSRVQPSRHCYSCIVLMI